ncbi:MAG: DUF615 domain-containing protein [Proteobacteria bacterium]|uniref:DUF615 domain-containing protein n=1 Tax=Candidatus Avisuccinivibrio stercorigallinarum TaxID=2840704 RepID=A0A9D9DCV9_9GAMM|nr:DUF615 domain-containing protein [Candidatus Avisuccinivibrio stercorigallinarum]
MAVQEFFSGFDAEPEEVSRSAHKREAQAVRKLAEDLSKLGDQAFNALTFPDVSIKEALINARTLRRNSDEKRRQLQYTAKLMRGYDLTDLKHQLSLQGAPAAVDPNAMRLENLRAYLLSGGNAALNELCALIYSIDRNKLRTLIKKAKIEEEKALPNKPALKEIYQYLKQVFAQSGTPIPEKFNVKQTTATAAVPAATAAVSAASALNADEGDADDFDGMAELDDFEGGELEE